MAQLPQHLQALPEETTVVTTGMSIDEWFAKQESNDCVEWYTRYIAKQKQELELSYKQWGATFDALLRHQREHAMRRQRRPHARDTVLHTHE